MGTIKSIIVMNENYSYGAGLIAQERWEQVNKHGWDIRHDADYSKGELIQAAMFCINPDVYQWPTEWDEHFKQKIIAKDKINRLRVAGAFIAAAIDRERYLLNSDKNDESNATQQKLNSNSDDGNKINHH